MNQHTGCVLCPDIRINMELDLTGLVVFAVIGFIVAVLLIIGLIIAIITWLLGYWQFSVTI